MGEFWNTSLISLGGGERSVFLFRFGFKNKTDYYQLGILDYDFKIALNLWELSSGFWKCYMGYKVSFYFIMNV